MAVARNMLSMSVIVVTLAVGCQSVPSSSVTATSAGPIADRNTGTSPAVVKPVAYVHGQSISRDQLWTAMIEASGGAVLEELVLDRVLEDRLQRQGVVLSDAQIQAERDALLVTLDDDPDQALRLLNELRARRGLGDERFARLLRRNAALRVLSAPGAEVGEAAIQQAYDMQYGPRYEARIIVVETLSAAAEVVRSARGGGSFIDLAIARSTDSSRAQGGLLDPISPADATYPQALRTVVAQLEEGQVSDPVTLERGYAVLKLERKIPAQSVKYDDVKEDLSQRVRRQVERVAMQQLARAILAQADVVVFDGPLQKQWNTRKQQLAAE